MTLIRKLRMVGSSLMATIPSDIGKILNLKDGDDVEFKIFVEKETNDLSIIIKKVEEQFGK